METDKQKTSETEEKKIESCSVLGEVAGILSSEKQEEAKSFEFERELIKIEHLPFPEQEWKEVDWEHGWQNSPLKLKVSPTGDIIEYAENITYQADVLLNRVNIEILMLTKGMQLYSYNALLEEISKTHKGSKEEIEKQYLMTEEELEEKMKDMPNKSVKYEKFFRKELQPFAIGCSLRHNHPTFKDTIAFPGHLCIWLAKGTLAVFGPETREVFKVNGSKDSMLASGLLLKKSKV